MATTDQNSWPEVKKEKPIAEIEKQNTKHGLNLISVRFNIDSQMTIQKAEHDVHQRNGRLTNKIR